MDMPCGCCLRWNEASEAVGVGMRPCARCGEPTCEDCLHGGQTCCHCDVLLEVATLYGEQQEAPR